MNNIINRQHVLQDINHTLLQIIIGNHSNIILKTKSNETDEVYLVKIKKFKHHYDSNIKILQYIKDNFESDIVRTYYKKYDIHNTIIFKYVEQPSMDLYEFIQKYTLLSEPIIKIIFKQLVKGIQLLHSINVTHGDIKPENIIITDQYPYSIKIIDMEDANIIPKKCNNVKPCTFGTLNYMSPEVYNDKLYYYKSDVWGLGMILYIISVSSFPYTNYQFNNINFNNITTYRKQFYNKIKKRGGVIMNSLEINLSSNLTDLIKKMLEVDINERLSINEILNHPWIVT